MDLESRLNKCVAYKRELGNPKGWSQSTDHREIHNKPDEGSSIEFTVKR
jgi:hypothetical protein